MRLGPIEINWSPKQEADDTVWHKPPLRAFRLGDMSPDRLRHELFKIHRHLHRAGGIPVIRSDKDDQYQRIYASWEDPPSAPGVYAPPHRD